MKKFAFLLVTMFLLFATSCEKEDETKLSEFIVGEWDSELVLINPNTEEEIPIYFYAKFGEEMFDLDFLTYPEKILWISVDSLNYTINSEFNLTIENPMEEGETVNFDVVWNPDTNKMVWIPTPDPDDNPPTMVFVKR
jgi:hypothetical protein